jgi:hypothetical protein
MGDSAEVRLIWCRVLRNTPVVRCGLRRLAVNWAKRNSHVNVRWLETKDQDGDGYHAREG